jgi:WD40 repeat protein
MKRKKFQKIYEVTNQNGNEKFITAELSYPNCELFAGSDETRSVLVYRVGLNNPILNLTGHSSPVNKMLLNSADAELYSGLRGGMIVLWDLKTAKVKINLQGHTCN